MPVNRIIILLLAALGWGCDLTDDVLVIHTGDGGLPNVAPFCTSTTPSDVVPPPEARCLEVPCYSQNSAPTVTESVAFHGGSGQPIEIVLWDAAIGVFPDSHSVVNTSGSGCIDCPERTIGAVTHTGAYDNLGTFEGESAGIVTAIDFHCGILSRPQTASNQVANGALMQQVFQCIDDNGLYRGEVKDWGWLTTVGLSSVDLQENVFGDLEWEATIHQRRRLGECLAEACAALNRFTYDGDGDGVGDLCDNCPDASNPDQSNIAGAWHGDICDDTDQDGVEDAIDNCISAPNPDQSDICGDDDGDGVPNGEDGCPDQANNGGPCRVEYDDDVAACEIQGSIVGVEQQTLGEVLALPGTGLALRYSSHRVPGYRPPGASARDARDLGFGGWSLSAQHYLEPGDPPQVQLGFGGSFPATRQLPHALGQLIPDPSDEVAYVFDDQDRHVQTIDATSGQILLTLSYANGHLSALTDANDQQVEISREPDAVVFTGPLGDQNTLRLDDNGFLASLTVPGDRIWMTFHGDKGLLESIATPRQVADDTPYRHDFDYDAEGLLIADRGLDGERLTLERFDTDDGLLVLTRRAMDRQDGEIRELAQHHRLDFDGGRRTAFAGRVQRTIALEGAALQGYESGYRTTDPDGGALVVRLDSGDRWAGEPSRGLTTFEPPPGAGLDPITLRTEERFVLADSGPLGSRTLERVERTTHRGEEELMSAVHWPQGDGASYGGLPYARALSPEGRRTTAVSKDGRIHAIHAGGLLPIEYAYDARGRIKQITQGQRTTRWNYNDATRTTVLTDSTGRQRRVTLDEALDVAQIDNPAADDSALTSEYDSGGALAQLTTPSGQHRWENDQGGRATRYIAPGNATTVYRRGLDGRPLEQIEADGRATRVEYAAISGRPTRVSTPESTTTHRWRGDLRPLETELSTQVLADGTEVHLVTTADYEGPRPTGSTLALSIDGVAHTVGVASTVDAATWDPETLKIIDDAGTTHALQLRADRDGLPTRIGDLTIARDGLGIGLPDVESLGALATAISYNNYGETREVALTHAGAPRFRQTFSRAATGELESIRTWISGDEVRWDYAFDEEGRLVQADSSTGESITYTYDAAGNRLRRTDSNGAEHAGVVDAGDRMQGYAGAAFTHNAMGQRVAATDTPTGDWTYTYDTTGGLRRAQGEVHDVEYVLDQAGRRIGRRVDGGPMTWWLYAGLSPIAEFDANLRLTKVFVYGTSHAPDHMITYADGEATGRYRFATDQVGSVVGVIRDDGVWVEHTTYTPFGRIISRGRGENAPTHPFGFAGGVYDEATGWVRFGARDYDPWTGRWTAKDPIGFAGGDVNLYAYVGNDPVRFFDPTGLRAFSKDWAVLNGLRAAGVSLSAGQIQAITAVTEPLALEIVAFSSEILVTATVAGTVFRLGMGAARLIGAARGALAAGRSPTPCTLGGGTIKFSARVSAQKTRRHIRGTAGPRKSYFQSMDDAQAVLDAYHAGNYRLIRERLSQSSVTIEVKSVTGRYVNRGNPNGLPDIDLPTNIFMIQGIRAPKPVPVNPAKGL